jgi:hypothetical protein
VSIASLKSEEGAEREAARAASTMAERFVVLGAQTDRGFFYRVVSGPYIDRLWANEQLANAKDAGYEDAWIWVGDADTALIGESTATDEFAFDDTDDFELPEFDEDFDLPEFEFQSDDDLLEDRVPVPKVVDEAPPGYQLNKLRRDAARALTRNRAWVAMVGSTPEPVYEELEEIVRDELPRQLLLNLPLGEPVALARFDERDIDVKIDGKLSEPQWQNIPGVDSFLVSDPDTLVKPRYQTVVKIFYTERGMYIGFDLEQPLDSLVQRFSGRDEGMLNRDAVSITLDTSGQGRYGYWMNLALGGNQTDGTVLPERQFSSDWDGAWEGATAVNDHGWDAEIFLPWSQVAMPVEEGERTINAYVSRKVAALDERWTIPALPYTQPLFISALQPLTLSQVNPRKQWSVFPYGSVTDDMVDGETNMKIGADIFYRPSTNFQITGALNPDFGNVESDDVIVNLSAFETFFPEKRLFFKEGIEIFDTSPRFSTRVLHTRRIGSRPRRPDVPPDVIVPGKELGQPTELLGAVKAVGAIGKVRYGVLTAFEDETKFDVGPLNFHQDGTDYGVARFLYEDKGSDGSYRALGMISTLATHPDQDAFVQGVDYHYLTSRGAVKVDGQLLYSDKDGVGEGDGGFVDVTYRPSRGMRYNFSASHYDDKLDINDLGFLRRNDVTTLGVNAEFRTSTPPEWAPWVRTFRWTNTVDLEINGDGDKTGKALGTRVRLDRNDRTEWRFDLNYHPERVDDRNSRGNGTYVKDAAHQTTLEFRSDSSKRVYYKLGLRHSSEEAGGKRVRGDVGVTWRPVEHFNIGATAQYQVRDGWVLWQGGQNFTGFETREWRPNVNMNYFLSAKQQLRLSAQWVGIRAEEKDFYTIPSDNGKLVEVDKPPGPSDDFAISNLALQFRYRWELAPLSELFVVYTLNGDQSVADSSFSDLLSDAYRDPSNEELVVKLRYRLGS